MPRIALTDLFQLPDIMSGDAFYFVLTGIPGATGNLRNLALKCLNVQIAGESNEKMTVPLASHQINFRGRRLQPQTLAVTYYEDQTMGTWLILKQWHEYIVGTLSGGSQGFKIDYAINGTLYTYNQINNNILITNYYNLFIQELPDLTHDGSSSTPMQVPVTMSYDYTDDSNVPAT